MSSWIRCPVCHKVKFVDTDNSIHWLQLNSAEEMAIDIILMSDPLLLMTEGITEYQETCCHCLKKNCN